MKATKDIQLLFLILTFGILAEAKIYSKCEFAKALKKQGIKELSKLATFTCIGYHESKFNTKAVNSLTGDYGILQINHRWWCSDSNIPGKGCHITCKSLLGDDITEDITCAKTVYAETLRLKKDGFLAWTTYKKYCLGDQSSWISGCGL